MGLTRHRGPKQGDPHREAPKFEVLRIEIYAPRLQESYLAEPEYRRPVQRALDGKVSVQSFEGLEMNEYLLYHGAPSIPAHREPGHRSAPCRHPLWQAIAARAPTIYTVPNEAGERCIILAHVQAAFREDDIARKEGWLKRLIDPTVSGRSRRSLR